MSLLKLKEGKMTGKEIAEWLKIEYDGTYRKNPKKQLEKLKDYCDYEQVRGGAIISNIRMPYYNPNYIAQDTEVYTKEIERCIQEQDGLASLSGITKVAQKQYKQIYENYTYNQVYYRMQKAGVSLFGIAKEKNSYGLLGSRHYHWAIKVDDYNHYRLLTEEEHEEFKTMLENYFSKLQATELEKRALIEEYFNKHEDATYKEYKDMLKAHKLNFFDEVIQAFCDKHHCRLAAATQHISGDIIVDLENQDFSF